MMAQTRAVAAACVGEQYLSNLGKVWSYIGFVDSTGTIQNRYVYNPWDNAIAGRTSGSAPNPFQYAGAMLDSTGLYKMGERYYDPSIGRFTQEDPAGGGYSYTGDNPVNYDDVSGLKKHKAKPKKTKKKAPKASSCDGLAAIGCAAQSGKNAVAGAVHGATGAVSSFAQRAGVRCLLIGGAADTASDTLIAAGAGVGGGATAGYYAYAEGGSPSIVASFAATGAADGYRAGGFFARNSPYSGYAEAVGCGVGILSAVKP